jgi:hypothetical protein
MLMGLWLHALAFSSTQIVPTRYLITAAVSTIIKTVYNIKIFLHNKLISDGISENVLTLNNYPCVQTYVQKIDWTKKLSAVKQNHLFYQWPVL